MATPFAALEARVNAACMTLLPNAAATIAGQPVDGILEHQYVETLDVAGVMPVFTYRSSDATGVARGQAVVIATINYVIRNIKPDGTGITVLILDEA